MELGHLPRFENLFKIAEFYDVSVDWLMGRTEKEGSRDTCMKFAEKIRMLRSELNLSQPAVAEQMGLSMRGYQNLELGAEPRYSSLLKVAEFYNVSVDWLMGRTEKREVNC